MNKKMDSRLIHEPHSYIVAAMSAPLAVLLALLLIALCVYSYGTALAYWWRYIPVLQKYDDRKSECRIRAAAAVAYTLFTAGFVAVIIFFLMDRNKYGFALRI